MRAHGDTTPARTVSLDRAPGSDSEREAAIAAGGRHSSVVTAWHPGSSSGFNVAIVVPADDRSPLGDCVVPLSHNYRMDALVLRRLEVLADVTSHRVVAVETPGVTMNFASPPDTGHTSVSATALGRAVFGRFSGIADLQTRALRDIAGVNVSKSRILGESLGAQLGSSLAVEAGSVLSLDLVEPVNARSLSIGRLLGVQRAFGGIESERKAQYLRQNRRDGWGQVTAFELSSSAHARLDRSLKSFGRQGKFAVAIAFGLSRGLKHTLGHLSAGSVVRVWRADASRVCLPEDVLMLRSQLDAKGISLEMLTLSATEDWPNGIGHHALTDLNLMYRFSARLRTVWGVEPLSDGSYPTARS